MGFFPNGSIAQRVVTLEGTAKSHETKIATLEQDVAGLKQANTTLQNGVEELNTTTVKMKVME